MKKLFYLLALICLPLMFSCTSEPITTTDEVQIEDSKQKFVQEDTQNKVKTICTEGGALGSHVTVENGLYRLHIFNGHTWDHYNVTQATAVDWCSENGTGSMPGPNGTREIGKIKPSSLSIISVEEFEAYREYGGDEISCTTDNGDGIVTINGDGTATWSIFRIGWHVNGNGSTVYGGYYDRYHYNSGAVAAAEICSNYGD